jgi:hypothetical protein
MLANNRSGISNERAGSLLEVMVAAAIMVLAFTGLLQVFLMSSLLSEMAGNVTASVSEAQAKIEEIRGHDFDDIATDYGVSGTPGDAFTSALLNGSGEINLTTLGTGLLQVEVIVSWNEKNGRAMATTLATNVAKRN